MPANRDWLTDPLMKPESPFDYFDPLGDEERNELWKDYHLSTRIKLEGAAYYCRCVLGLGSMPLGIGVRDTNHKKLEWYLDAFFFELMSAYEVILQKLNILYSTDSIIEEKDVKWSLVKELLTTDMSEYIRSVRETLWFRKLRQHRNRSAHHSHVNLASWSAGFGDRVWHHDSHDIYMSYVDPLSNQLQLETVKECREYLNKMLDHIYEIWKRVADEFNVQTA